MGGGSTSTLKHKGTESHINTRAYLVRGERREKGMEERMRESTGLWRKIERVNYCVCVCVPVGACFCGLCKVAGIEYMVSSSQV